MELANSNIKAYFSLSGIRLISDLLSFFIADSVGKLRQDIRGKRDL